ncbi:MAG: hydroxymethylbilane synthase [Rhodothermales bacterium]|nr:hydroxymethylbilane synthase [Rhodothermales bacterium]
MPDLPDPFVLGTRGSALAMWQARHVQASLEAAGHRVALEEIVTTGDRILDVPLAEIGDKGLFTKQLDDALLAGRIHLAVHSLKDLPTRLPDGLVLAAVGERAAPWDAFVGRPGVPVALEALPEGAVLATSSLRRRAQLRAFRPDVQVVDVRGNVDTRLRKLDEGDWDGLVLAEAGLLRLGLAARITHRIDPAVMVPAVGQGALGIVCAEDAAGVRQTLHAALHHAPSAAAVTAERAFLRRLEGGCQAPIGAHARLHGGRLRLDGLVAGLDGEPLLRGSMERTPGEAEALGAALADQLLGHGAGAILDEIRRAHGA